MSHNLGIMLAALKMSICKPPASRNYEDLLVIKEYIAQVQFFRSISSSLSSSQMDQLSR